MKYRNKNFILGTVALFIAVVMCVSSFTFSVYAADLGTLNVWKSSSYTIGKWSSIPTRVNLVYSNTIGDTAVPLSSITNTAVDEWNYALNTNMSCYNTGSSGPLTMYTGTKAEMRALGLFSHYENDNVVGSTVTTKNFYGTWNCPAIPDKAYSYTITRAYCVVYYISGRPAERYANTAVHELGHALGWFGHSTSSSDVMYSNSNTRTSLTYNEISHLRQLYMY